MAVRDSDGIMRHIGSAQCAQRICPADTLAVPLALVGLASGQLTPAALQGALRDPVSMYSRLALSLDTGRLQRYFEQLDYGNRGVIGGVDRCGGDPVLRISADEQLRFVQALHERRLGLSRHDCGVVERSLFCRKTSRPGLFAVESTTRVRADRDGEHAPSWFVGWVELPRNTVYFAANWLPSEEVGGLSVELLSRAVLSDLRATLGII